MKSSHSLNGIFLESKMVPVIGGERPAAIIAFPAAYSQGCVTVCLDVPAPAPPAGGQLVTVDELGLSRFRIVRMAAEVVVLVACIDESL
jgi:hypothetical protein